MPEPIIDSFLNFLSKIFIFDVGTSEFYVMLGVTLGVWLVVARLLSGLFGSDKGILVCAVAVAAPLLLAGIAYVAVELYALPKIEAEWAPVYLPWAGFGLLALVATLLISNRVWGLGGGLSLMILLLSGAAAWGAYLGAEIAIDVMDKGSSQMEQRDKRLDKEMELSL